MWLVCDNNNVMWLVCDNSNVMWLVCDNNSNDWSLVVLYCDASIVFWFVDVPPDKCYYVTIGLICSMFGDWFLTWFKRYFIYGVVSFALAHVAYIAAVGLHPLHLNSQTFYLFATIAFLLVIVVCTRLPEPKLIPAVFVYICIICTMAWRACEYHIRLQTSASGMVFAGALVFMLSDFCIFVNQWVRRVSRGKLVIMLTYYTAQALFAAAVLMPSLNILMGRSQHHM